eukprot:1679708-Alexandrium_andersonii.AAC.1
MSRGKKCGLARIGLRENLWSLLRAWKGLVGLWPCGRARGWVEVWVCGRLEESAHGGCGAG